VKTLPALATVRDWLDEIEDPEIPALSITDLGIVRDVRYVDDVLEVALTPTYAGCPATQVIRDDVERTLRARGVDRLRITERLAPAWTSEWLSVRGRERLHEYGIAPPHAAAEAGLALGPIASAIVRCPRCASGETREQSRFGSTPCKALYRCDACGEPFEYFKPH
jgi:ring-1,2-phenylacetyl-CoA epoxidase subunit PaaD